MWECRGTALCPACLTFGRTGAVVRGQGPLELVIVPADKGALLRFIDRSVRAESLGPLVVHAQR